MKSRMLYVAITRAKHNKQINFCDGECYKAYTGHIYSYEYNGKFYIGSTVNLKKENKNIKTGRNQVVLNFNTQSNYMDLITSNTRFYKQFNIPIFVNCGN